MKLKSLQALLSKNKLNSILLVNSGTIDPSIFYFTGMDLERAFLVVAGKKADLLVNKLEVWRAQQESRIKSVKEAPPSLSELGGLKGNVGVNFDYLTMRAAEALRKQGLQLADVSAMLSGLRETKTEEEIARIRRACAIADEIIEGCISSFSSFKTEGQAKAWLNRKAIEKGAELAFPTIVASGKNAAMPHYNGAGKLQKGFCVIDYGVKFKGYCSDTTRTVYIGKPSEQEKLLYNKLLFCQEETSAHAKPGKSMEELERFSRAMLGDLDENFIHRLGHSVGIEVHDPLQKTTPLKEGMAVTIEPGVYFKNKLGIRIEDTVLIKKNGCEALTRVFKGLRTVNM